MKPFTVFVSAVCFFLLFSSTVPAAESAPESPQSLYLQAGKLERQGNTQQAQTIYESLIDRYPASEFAVKANDRLLQLLAPVAATDAKPAPITAKSLPAVNDPKRRGRMLFELKQRAAKIFSDEKQSKFYAYSTLHSHRYNRGELRDKEIEWDKAAEEKVRKELGMGSDEIDRAIEEICQQLKVSGKCDASQFQEAPTTP
ncbi:MAG: hypothetical protein HZC44_06760 [Geobacter sp.]|nr:hypothetical protein [Geobacter sp.]